MSSQMSAVSFVRNETTQKRINQLLGSRAPQLTTSLITAINSNDKLAKCKPESVLNAALTAASMDLPINPNLGFAYIVPYGDEAQFQMGWKGFVQLAQRSGFYKTINVTDIREGELKDRHRLSGEIEFEFIANDDHRDKLPIVGYVSYFRLMNGFEKTLYMTAEEVEAHAVEYSKSYAYDKKKNYTSSNWSTNFEAMARKTVLKLLISKYGPMNTQLQEAVTKDQAVIDDNEIVYVDNDKNELKEVYGNGGGRTTYQKWTPSGDKPVNDNQHSTIQNLLRQRGITTKGDINDYMYENYGGAPENELDAQIVIDNLNNEKAD